MKKSFPAGETVAKPGGVAAPAKAGQQLKLHILRVVVGDKG